MTQEINVQDIDLKGMLFNWMARKQFRSKGRGTLWASESSAAYTNAFGEREVVGKCHRAVYYRLTGVTPSNPPGDKSQMVFMLGNAVEDSLREMCKQAGIWENNSVRWEDKPRNLSGEYDIILNINNNIIGLECKSFYGYAANKQLLGHYSGRGSKKIWNPGTPKDEHLMQTAIYVDQSELDAFILFYISRDKYDLAQFIITLDEEKNIYINGIKNERYSLNDVYNRYALMNTYINNEVKPQRDFTCYPSDDRVQVLYERGEISKTAYDNHVNQKERCIDWHCSYCDYKDHCNADTDA